ncbi:hypothetical protein B0H19DRAFT_1068921 [Mycena capillaripes]|nr:hypothetical protein B0H19DRAFT_1068921 [Mycena capillaripes]
MSKFRKLTVLRIVTVILSECIPNCTIHLAVSGEYAFPEVRSLVLHSTAKDMLKLCPNLDNLTLTRAVHNFTLRTISKYAPKLRAFRIRSHISVELIKDFVDLFPNLTEMPLLHIEGLTPVIVQQLANMKHLCLVTDGELFPSGELLAAALELVTAGRQLLRSTSPHGRDSTDKLVTVKSKDVLRTYPVG